MEIFTTKYADITHIPLQTLDTVLYDLGQYIKKRMKTLANVTFEFMSPYTIKNETIFKSIYKNLKMVALNIAESPTISTSPDPDLRTALFDLYSANSEEAARQIYKSQSHFWEALKYSQADLNKDIRFLAIRFPNQHLKLHVLKHKQHKYTEESFLRNISQIERIFNRNNNQKYKECLWILCNVRTTEVTEIFNTLETSWKEQDFITRIDRFCHQLDSLYQIASYAENHAPISTHLPNKCQPGSADYGQYIRDLAHYQRNADITVVAHALYAVPLPVPNAYVTEATAFTNQVILQVQIIDEPFSAREETLQQHVISIFKDRTKILEYLYKFFFFRFHPIVPFEFKMRKTKFRKEKMNLMINIPLF